MVAMKGVWFAVLGISVLCFTPSIVSAQADGVTARARALFDRGVAHYQVGDYEAALVEFEEAYRLKPHPIVRVNMASCFERLGKPVEALYHYEMFLRESGNNVHPTQRDEVQKSMDALKMQIGDLWMVVEPAGANIKIDNEAPVVAPLAESVRLSAGRHRVEVSMEGYAPERHDISIEPQRRSELRIVLRRETASAIQGSSGMETTQANAPGNRATGAGATSRHDARRPSQFKRRLTTPVLVAGGISIALLVSGIGTGVSALAANSDFDDAVSRANNPALSPATRERAREDGHAAADRANHLALASDVLFGGALIGTGVTLLLYFTQKPKRIVDDETNEAAHIVASPRVTSNSAEISFSGKF